MTRRHPLATLTSEDPAECREEAGEEKTMFVGSAAELVEAR